MNLTKSEGAKRIMLHRFVIQHGVDVGDDH